MNTNSNHPQKFSTERLPVIRMKTNTPDHDDGLDVFVNDDVESDER